ncbi:DUF2637 domain-containing protein [Streptomyces sp. TRM66268-LWL]|uniref:DUF2637 domain-containing protein n=1 Tax=Streptomyces polyasparticus TaxID=2767826 RepID=A0ABR7SGL7_9ACTN|nr:DUF2637 domain-containing protein [Streptomyces polyasparticus]MBC9714635.1 DUF2637 domain-containing protein [Streptomyces polyasparticus]
MRNSLRFDAVLIQAVIAGALSFAHLHDIAEAAGQHGWKAWAYPVSVDLLLVAAWRRLRQGRTPRLAWCWFLIALFASLGANVATAGFLDLDHAPAWLRFLVAGWPALAFLGGTLLAHGTDPESKRETAVPAEFAAPAESAPEPVPAVVDVPDPARQLPPAKPAVNVPPALVDHARKVADAHRARTGHPIDTDTLRTQLGVPAPMASAIAAQLT